MMSQVIPEGWLEQPIGNIANVVAGGTPKAGNLNNFAMPGSEIAWLTPADLSKYNRKSISHGARDLSQEGYDSSSAKLMPKGALLFSSRAPIGYVVIAENPICTNQGFKNFVFTEQVNSTYAFYYLKSIRGLAESLGSGTTFKELSGATAKTLPFRLAPLAEQKAIADKLDELLAQVENTKTRLDAIPAILKSFRQSVLVAAVRGELTENWRENNSVSSVECSLSAILSSRSKLVTSRTKVPQAHLISEEYEIHKSWKWVSLDLLSSKIVDGVHHKPIYVESGIPFMSVKDIKNGQVSFNHCKYISEETHKDIHARCNPEKGDLLITKSGTIGRTAIIKTSQVFDLFVSVALIKPASRLVNMKYIDIALRQWVNSIDVSSRVVGTAIKNLHLRDMRVLAIPFAPIEEQTEVVRCVEELFAFADKIESQINAAQERVNNLTQSILAKAFRGELTADWRTINLEQISGDNSVEALLEKIKAERELLVVKKKVPKKKSAVTKTKKLIHTDEPSMASFHPIESLLNEKEFLTAQRIFESLSSELSLTDVFTQISQLLKNNKIIESSVNGEKGFLLKK